MITLMVVCDERRVWGVGASKGTNNVREDCHVLSILGGVLWLVAVCVDRRFQAGVGTKDHPSINHSRVLLLHITD